MQDPWNLLLYGCTTPDKKARVRAPVRKGSFRGAFSRRIPAGLLSGEVSGLPQNYEFQEKTGGWEMAIQTEIKGFWSKTP
jgi:hypothetical protein